MKMTPGIRRPDPPFLHVGVFGGFAGGVCARFSAVLPPPPCPCPERPAMRWWCWPGTRRYATYAIMAGVDPRDRVGEAAGVPVRSAWACTLLILPLPSTLPPPPPFRVCRLLLSRYQYSRLGLGLPPFCQSLCPFSLALHSRPCGVPCSVPMLFC